MPQQATKQQREHETKDGSLSNEGVNPSDHLSGDLPLRVGKAEPIENDKDEAPKTGREGNAS